MIDSSARSLLLRGDPFSDAVRTLYGARYRFEGLEPPYVLHSRCEVREFWPRCTDPATGVRYVPQKKKRARKK